MSFSSITIDDRPIPLDWRHQLHDFLSLRLPPEDVLFCRYHDRPIVNPLGCDNAPDYLRLPYPPLPPIEIGEYQCPTGMSRYGRALVVVDWSVLRYVGEKCWGMTSTISGDDVPLDWKIPSTGISDSRVDLTFRESESRLFTIKNLIPLPPYRIPGSKRDLWLLPLVDQRYRKVKDSHKDSIDAETWEGFFNSIADFETEDEIPEEYGIPDERLTTFDFPQQSAILADIGALSVGLRIVYDPVGDFFRLVNSDTSKDVRIRRMAAPWIEEPDSSSPTSPMLIAGGRTGSAAYVSSVRVHHIKNGNSDFWRIKHFPHSGINTSSFSIWTSWNQDDSEDEGLEPEEPNADDRASDFCQQVADDLWGWMDSGGQYCFVGILPITRTEIPEGHDPEDPESPQPIVHDENACGFDDYFSIQIKENPAVPEEYIFTHRFYELPPMFLPDVLLVNGKKEACNAAIQGEILEVVEDESSGKYAKVKVTAVSKCANPKDLINQEIRVYDISNEILDVEDSDSLIGEWIAAKQYVVNVEGSFKCRWLADNRGCVDEDGGE